MIFFTLGILTRKVYFLHLPRKKHIAEIQLRRQNSGERVTKVRVSGLGRVLGPGAREGVNTTITPRLVTMMVTSNNDGEV